MGRRLYLCVTVLAAVSIICPAQIFQTPKAVRLTVSTEKRSYKIGENIVASYRLQNVSNKKLYVPVRFSADCPPRERLVTDLQKEGGKVIAGGFVSSCSPRTFPSLLEKLKADSKLLSPREQYAPEERFDTRGLKPGLYRVTARLSAWKPGEFSEIDKQELRKFGVPVLTGRLSSSVIVRLTR